MTMITYTVFPGPLAHKGIDKKEITSTWDAFCMRVAAAQEYPDKGAQPLIKLAMFSNHRTAAHSLRHDANVMWVTGIEGDYDRGEVRMEQAVEMLERAGVRAVLHSSASSTDEKPRWRVLCPLSEKRTPDARAALVARLNGVLGGILANESFTLSQSYYVGRVPGGVYTTAVTFEDTGEGSCIDELDELDELAIGRSSAGVPIAGACGSVAGAGLSLGVEMFEARVAELGRKLRTGDGRRDLIRSYLASRSARGLGEAELIKLVEAVVGDYFDPADPIDQGNILAMIRSFAIKDRGTVVQPVDMSGLMAAGGMAGAVAGGSAQTGAVVIDLDEMRERARDVAYERVPGAVVPTRAMPVEAAQALVRWIDGCGEDSHRLVSIAAAMSVICAAAARRYVSATGDPASDYMAVVAPSVSMARYALTACEQVLNEAGFRAMLRTQRFSNVGQVYGALYKAPALLALSDDLGEMQRFARRQPSGVTEQTLSLITGRVHAGETMCLDAWSDLGFGVKQPDGGPEAPVIYAPSLTWLSIVGAQHLGGLFASGEFARGSVDSILLIPAVEAGDWAQRPRVARAAVPVDVLTRIRNMRGFEDGQTLALKAEQIFGGTSCVMASPAVVDFPPLVSEIDAAWIARYANRGQQARQLARGARGHLRRWVTALAAFACPQRPVVTDEIVIWCRDILAGLLDASIDAANLRGQDDDAKPDAYQKVLEFIGDRGVDGASYRTIVNGCRAFRALPNDKRKELLSQMDEDGACKESKTLSGRGTVFLLAKHVASAEKGQRSVDV
jgi:hypothetical protein